VAPAISLGSAEEGIKEEGMSNACAFLA